MRSGTGDELVDEGGDDEGGDEGGVKVVLECGCTCKEISEI
jgi:hypothetical protein